MVSGQIDGVWWTNRRCMVDNGKYVRTINHQPSTIHHQPSTINHQPTTNN
ncbi:MAG: hypothetical protein VKN72_24495 [Nostocales cyanobacterium 94392]|nr:hypothetical protein [Nostocales cyanobacterium 94392]